jgi:large subunit ribosomal protein L22
VLDTIRGRSYEEALILMEYMPYRACEKILKCLLSVSGSRAHPRRAPSSSSGPSPSHEVPFQRRLRAAEAGALKRLSPDLAATMQAAENAKNNQGASKSSLVVCEAFANQGPVMKRIRPRAQGK